jgi:hypothetical protein
MRREALMLRPALIAAACLALAGCATATLPYTPEQQPPGARVSAAYQLLGDRLRIELDTNGRGVEEVEIVRADGSAVRPLAIEQIPVGPGSPPVGVGVGVGGTRWGGRGVGVGTGVSIGFPVGGGRPDLNTFAYFPLDEAGPAPWQVRVKLAGIEPTLIVVGAAR